MPDDILLGLVVTIMARLAGWNHQQLARKIGVNPRTVTNWSKRRGGISDANLSRAALELNCPIDVIFALATDLRRWLKHVQVFPRDSKPTAKQGEVAELSPLDHFSEKELYFELGRVVAREEQLKAEIRARGFPL